MLNITNHWRNEKQSYNEIPHPLGWPVFKKKKNQRTGLGKDVEKQEDLCTVSRNAMVQPLWQTVWQFLKKLKIELPYDPAIPF